MSTQYDYACQENDNTLRLYTDNTDQLAELWIESAMEDGWLVIGKTDLAALLDLAGYDLVKRELVSVPEPATPGRGRPRGKL